MLLLHSLFILQSDNSQNKVLAFEEITAHSVRVKFPEGPVVFYINGIPGSAMFNSDVVWNMWLIIVQERVRTTTLLL